MLSLCTAMIDRAVGTRTPKPFYGMVAIKEILQIAVT